MGFGGACFASCSRAAASSTCTKDSLSAPVGTAGVCGDGGERGAARRGRGVERLPLAPTRRPEGAVHGTRAQCEAAAAGAGGGASSERRAVPRTFCESGGGETRLPNALRAARARQSAFRWEVARSGGRAARLGAHLLLRQRAPMPERFEAAGAAVDGCARRAAVVPDRRGPRARALHGGQPRRRERRHGAALES